MASDYSALLANSTALFDTAMPPLTRGQGFSTASYAVTLPDRTSVLAGFYSSAMNGSGRGYGGDGTWLSEAATPSTIASRSVEASLLRREWELRNEYYRIQAEDQCKSRQQRDAQRRQEEEEERQRTMEIARQIEEERAKRVEAQQERLLQKERELEEWKMERVKEAEALRRQQLQEDERRLELRHEREMARIKEEANVRAAAVQRSDDLKQAMQEIVEKMQSTMQAKMRDEIRALEEAHKAVLSRREEDWTQRVQSLELTRSTELADLTHQLQQDQTRAARSEEQLREARDQLTRLLHEMDQLKVQLQSGGPQSEKNREAAQQLAATHRSSIERLQQMYDEDKKMELRRYNEEKERLRYECDRRVEELRDGHASALRNKENEADELRRRVTQLEQELLDERAKLAMLRVSGEQMTTTVNENARLKDEVRQLQTTKSELEDTKKRLERNLREADVRTESLSRQLQALQAETVAANRQVTAERDELRRENADLKSQLAVAKDNYEEETTRLQRLLTAAEAAAAHVNLQEVETSARRAVDKAEEERRAVEGALAQVNRKLKATEDELQASRRAVEAAQRDTAQARERAQELQTKLDERSAQLRKLEVEAQEKASLSIEVREMKERHERLQADFEVERESGRKQHEAALAAKDNELQQLRGELLEVNKRLHALREENASRKLDKEDQQQRLARQLTEKEEEVAQMRRQLEDSRQSLQQWKQTYEELQQRSGTNTEDYQRAVRERDAELEEIRRRMRQVLEEKSTLEQKLRAEETAHMSANAQSGDVQRALREREAQIERLEREVRELRDRPATASSSVLWSPAPTNTTTNLSATQLPIPGSAASPPQPPPPTPSVVPLSVSTLQPQSSLLQSAAVSVMSFRPASSAAAPPVPLPAPTPFTIPAAPSSSSSPPPVTGVKAFNVDSTASSISGIPVVPTAKGPTTAGAGGAGASNWNQIPPPPQPVPTVPPKSLTATPAPPVLSLQPNNSFDRVSASNEGTSDGTPLNIPVPTSLTQSPFQVGQHTDNHPSLTVAVPTPAGALSHMTSVAQYAAAPTPAPVVPRSPQSSDSHIHNAGTTAPSVPAPPAPQITPAKSIPLGGFSIPPPPVLSTSANAPPPPAPQGSIMASKSLTAPTVSVPVPAASGVGSFASPIPVPIPVPTLGVPTVSNATAASPLKASKDMHRSHHRHNS